MPMEDLTTEFSEGEALEQLDDIARTKTMPVLIENSPLAYYLDFRAEVEPKLHELGIKLKYAPRIMNFVLGWADSEWGEEGRKKRNLIARRLRKIGYDVESKTVDFTDLARDSSYLLEAHWPMSRKPPFGADTHYQHINGS